MFFYINSWSTCFFLCKIILYRRHINWQIACEKVMWKCKRNNNIWCLILKIFWYKLKQCRGTGVTFCLPALLCSNEVHYPVKSHIQLHQYSFHSFIYKVHKHLNVSRSFCHCRSSVSQQSLKLEIDMYFLTCLFWPTGTKTALEWIHWIKPDSQLNWRDRRICIC
jgi:hypothetical protein